MKIRVQGYGIDVVESIEGSLINMENSIWYFNRYNMKYEFLDFDFGMM